MKIDLTSVLPRRTKKKLECSWPKLLDIRKYKIPTTIEELDFDFRELKINGVNHYFSQATKREIKDFSSIIFDHQSVNSLFCYDTIYKSVVSEIGYSLGSEDKKSFDDALDSISSKINIKLDQFQFYFPLFGLRLKDIIKVSIGEAYIINFDENFSKKILERNGYIHSDQLWTKQVEDSFNKHFIKKSVIVIPVNGDRIKAEEIAREKAKLITNYLRFVICLLAHDRIDENLIKISIDLEWMNMNSEFFYEAANKLSFANDPGPRPLQAFEFSQARLEKLKEKAFFDDFCRFMLDDQKSELEKCIITSIHWIGEAQNDINRESSYLKYWIALESIFTQRRKSESPRITHGLCQGVSVLLVYCGYDFGEVLDRTDLYKKTSFLYELRSDIVHSGAHKRVSYNDISNICKYSSWVVLCLLWYRDYLGVVSMNQMETVINILAEYEDLPATDEIKMARINRLFWHRKL
ncbi:hypothetical protein HC024_06345 [Methylococcaceae bacterium WWC4]|nr:hypothetical protein [Methylococcaceae bacterium WWC4]